MLSLFQLCDSKIYRSFSLLKTITKPIDIPLKSKKRTTTKCYCDSCKDTIKNENNDTKNEEKKIKSKNFTRIKGEKFNIGKIQNLMAPKLF